VAADAHGGVNVENKGIRFGVVDLLQKLKRGEPVDPRLIYFRTVPKFETGHEKYRWLWSTSSSPPPRAMSIAW
jgi:hypothetical protein